MKRSESKYFNTAAKMDEAFLELLEKKDLPYITVKEICEKAGVNRSTFYLHYETIGDLLAESAEYLNRDFLEHMKIDSSSFAEKIADCCINELFLITPEYLVPYLTYIKEHRRLFSAAICNAETLRLERSYDGLSRHILMPILERYNVPENDRGYLISFYISGLMAIIEEWIRRDCADPIEYITGIMQNCVMPHNNDLGR